MKLADIFSQNPPPPHFENFRRSINPVLDASRVSLQRRLVTQGGITVPLHPQTAGALQIYYKGEIGGVLGIIEEEDGEIWHIPQVQGARSSKSYRIATGLRWEACLAEDVRRCASLPDACVRRIVMPPVFEIKNIDGAASQEVCYHYRAVQMTLSMRWSPNEGLWITDLRE